MNAFAALNGIEWWEAERRLLRDGGPKAVYTLSAEDEAVMDSKWQTEEIWRKSLAMQRAALSRYQQPEWAHLGQKEIEKARRRVERIWSAGLPDWQARDNS